MKQTALFLSIILLQIANVLAAPIDERKALNIAESFYNQTTGKAFVKGNSSFYLTLAYTCQEEARSSTTLSPYYYIFNRSDEQGFIIISGDDQTKNVLGYSDNGQYDPDNLPENFKVWMNYYKEGIKALSQNNSKKINLASTVQTQSSYADFIEPLLNNISWNQSSPYNNLCPLQGNSRSVTGCVATAMAQLMRYHKWPAQGQGSNTYTPPNFETELTVDFSQSVYDWENMTETYNSTSTNEEREAVAKLMYDCGVAVNMQYSPYASGAYSPDVPIALKTYFNYDENLQMHYRRYYTSDEWLNLLKTELNNDRPVYYAGQSTSSGHAFICDGYDSNDLFHINWGWGGTSNGYFEVALLNPSQQGIGGSDGGYSMDQNIITGVQPPGNTSEETYIITLETNLSTREETISRESPIILNRTRISNMGCNIFNGELALGLFLDNTLIEIYNSALIELNDFSNSRIEWEGFNISSEIANGTYQLYTIHRIENHEWQINKSSGDIKEYLELIITDNEINFSSPSSLFIPEGSFYAATDVIIGQEAVFEFSMENPGREVHSTMGVLLINTENEYQLTLLSMEAFSIKENEAISSQMVFTLNVPTGEYYLCLGYTNGYSFESFEGESEIIITVEEAGPAPIFSLEEELAINQLTFEQGETAKITALLTNTGGRYNNRIYATVYQSRNSLFTNTIDQIETIISIDSNETQEITFTKEIDYSPGNYYIRLSYRSPNNTITTISGNQNRIDFTVDGETGIDNSIVNQLTIYPNPVEDIINIQQQGNIESIYITDISGKILIPYHSSGTENEISIPVEKLNPGIYLIQITTQGKRVIKKFIKK